MNHKQQDYARDERSRRNYTEWITKHFRWNIVIYSECIGLCVDIPLCCLLFFLRAILVPFYPQRQLCLIFFPLPSAGRPPTSMGEQKNVTHARTHPTKPQTFSIKPGKMLMFCSPTEIISKSALLKDNMHILSFASKCVAVCVRSSVRLDM